MSSNTRLDLLKAGLAFSCGLAAALGNAASISGSVTYRERMALSPSATLEVSVEDISRADTPARLIGQLKLMPAGQVPISFQVPYDESAIQPGHRFGVRARILQDGRLLFTTTQVYPVLTQGAGDRVDNMIMQRVMTSQHSPDRPLTNTYWKLKELKGFATDSPPTRREAHIILQGADSRLAGSGGCNRIMSTFQIDGKSLSFGKIASTMMACPDDANQESVFFRALEQARGWRISGDNMELTDADGAVLARFVAIDLR